MKRPGIDLREFLSFTLLIFRIWLKEEMNIKEQMNIKKGNKHWYQSLPLTVPLQCQLRIKFQASNEMDCLTKSYTVIKLNF